MKYLVQIFFSNDKSHNFYVDCIDEEDMHALLEGYQDQRNDLALAGSDEQPCLFNPKNVILIVASPAKEIEEEVETICCSEGKCHK